MGCCRSGAMPIRVPWTRALKPMTETRVASPPNREEASDFLDEMGGFVPEPGRAHRHEATGSGVAEHVADEPDQMPRSAAPPRAGERIQAGAEGAQYGQVSTQRLSRNQPSDGSLGDQRPAPYLGAGRPARTAP